MKLKEFDSIRPYLPNDVEIIIKSSNNEVVEAEPVMEPAMEIAYYGNHDGRFNLRCRCCGYYSKDIPREQRSVMEIASAEMPCPRCGAIKHIKGSKKNT